MSVHFSELLCRGSKGEWTRGRGHSVKQLSFQKWKDKWVFPFFLFSVHSFEVSQISDDAQGWTAVNHYLLHGVINCLNVSTTGLIKRNIACDWYIQYENYNVQSTGRLYISPNTAVAFVWNERVRVHSYTRDMIVQFQLRLEYIHNFCTDFQTLAFDRVFFFLHSFSNGSKTLFWNILVECLSK